MKRFVVLGGVVLGCGSTPAAPTAPVVEVQATAPASASAPAPASASAPTTASASASAPAPASATATATLGALGGGDLVNPYAQGTVPLDLSGAVGSTPPQGTKAPASPKGEVAVGPITTTNAAVDAARIAAGLRPRFRQCYQVGLNSDHTMSGKLTIGVEVDPNGDVTSANVISNTGLSVGVAACVAGVAKRATFTAPGGSGAKVSIVTSYTLGK